MFVLHVLIQWQLKNKHYQELDGERFYGIYYFTTQGITRYFKHLIDTEERCEQSIQVVSDLQLDLDQLHGDKLAVKHIDSMVSLNGLKLNLFSDFMNKNEIISGICKGLLKKMNSKFPHNDIIRMLYVGIIFDRCGSFSSVFLNMNLKLIRKFYKIICEIFPYGTEFSKLYNLKHSFIKSHIFWVLIFV